MYVLKNEPLKRKDRVDYICCLLFKKTKLITLIGYLMKGLSKNEEPRFDEYLYSLRDCLNLLA